MNTPEKGVDFVGSKESEHEVPTRDQLPDIPSPYLYRVVIFPLKAREKTAAGILLPGQAQDAESMMQQFGVVVSVGKGAFIDRQTGECQFDPKPKRGDLVLYARYSGAGRVVVKDGVKLLIVADIDILMKIDDLTGYSLH